MSDIARAYVSTGHLPTPSEVDRLLRLAYEKSRDDETGAVSTVYPALSEVSPHLFGISVAGVDGRVRAVGDANKAFPIMSASKPFVFALACEIHGPRAMRQRVGVNATGLPFNAVEALASDDGRTNPMVNAGAIATTSLIPGNSRDDKWQHIQSGLSAFAARDLSLNHRILQSASDSNFRNREIVDQLHALGRVYADPDEALDLYTRQCSLDVTAVDLSVMGATLADGGVNPVTGLRVVAPLVCRHTLAVMATAGLYETSGDWLYDVGLPGKSGIGGGIVTVAPGKGGVGAFAPLLDEAGNSIKGQRATRYLAEYLGLDLFSSQPFSPAD